MVAVCLCDCRSDSAGGFQHSAQTPEDERGLRAGRELKEELQHQRFLRSRQRERRADRPERHHPDHRYDGLLPPVLYLEGLVQILSKEWRRLDHGLVGNDLN